MPYLYSTDHLGSIRAVRNALTGAAVSRSDYEPYGAHTTLSGTPQRYRYNGKEDQSFAGTPYLDYGARQYDPAIGRWMVPDPLAEKNVSSSPYAFCSGNPINYIDPKGCDTVRVEYNSEKKKWMIAGISLSSGDDVFIVKNGNETNRYVFSEAEYGERVIALNLDINASFTLGIMYVSGMGTTGAFYYVTKGGKASNENNSGRRVKDGKYPIHAPTKDAKWRQPGLGGNVAKRGIRFHYGGPNPIGWTDGCYVLCYDYAINNSGEIEYDLDRSIGAVQHFDYLLGADATAFYPYQTTNSRGKLVTREGAVFSGPINFQFVVKSLK